jgi:hypothetical protein
MVTCVKNTTIDCSRYQNKTIEGVSPEVRIISHGLDMCNNIYGEVPYMDSSSRYVIYLKLGKQGDIDTGDWQAYCDAEIWRADLKTKTSRRVEEHTIGMRCMAVSPDHKYFYYIKGYYARDCLGVEIKQIVQLNIVTLEKHIIDLYGPHIKLTSLGSITPDNRYLISGISLGNKLYSIAKVDLQSGEVKVIFEAWPGIYNPHTQVDPQGGRDVMIQLDRNRYVDRNNNVQRNNDGLGITLFLIDVNGRNYRPLPVGKPVTDPEQGHQSWMGKTGSILFTTIGSMEMKAEQGNIFTIRPGDIRPRAIARGYMYWHCNSSRCGRYFVADTRHGPIKLNADKPKDSEERYTHQPIPYESLIIIGSVATGKTRILCPSKAVCKKPQYTHSHPYFSPDSKWVIFNTEQDGIPHVAAARVPDGLLAELDSSTK